MQIVWQEIQQGVDFTLSDDDEKDSDND